MKIHWSSIAQNVISGCVGAGVVMSVAHAQNATPTVAPVISAHRFNLVDDDGTVCGWWSADKERVAFQMFHDKARTSLVDDGEHAIFSVLFATDKEKANHCALISNETSTSVFLNDDAKQGSIGAFIGDGVQDERTNC